MEKIEVPEGLDKEKAEKTLERKAKRQNDSSGGNSKSKKSSGDDGVMDWWIAIGAILLALGLAADKIIEVVLSLF